MNASLPSVVALDIGTHTVTALVARVNAPDDIEVVGMGQSPNRGMSKGAVLSLSLVIDAIKEAVAQAEDMADCRVHSAWIAIPSPHLKSFNASGRVTIKGSIGTNELVAALNQAKSSFLQPDHYLINANPLGVSIDDNEDWSPMPLGLTAQSHIVSHFHLMMLPVTFMQNLDKAVKGAGLAVERMLVSTLATSEAALLPHEREDGVCLIDMGAGTTNVAVYLQNRLILSRTFTVGGENVTRDIATILNIPVDQAETLKLRYGCVDPALVRSDHMLHLPAQGAAPAVSTSRVELTEIILARYHQTLEKVRAELEHEGALPILRHGVVLAGQASRIEGLVTLARQVFGTPAHLANTPNDVRHVDPDESRQASLRQPAYLTGCGVLMYSQNDLHLQELNEESLMDRSRLMERLITRPWRGVMSRLKSVL